MKFLIADAVGVILVLGILYFIIFGSGNLANKARAKFNGNSEKEQYNKDHKKICRNCVYYTGGTCYLNKPNTIEVDGDHNYCSSYKNSHWI